MTFDNQELFQLGFMKMPESLTDKEQKAFISIRVCFWYASVSGCETATFNLTDTELIASSKAERFVMRNENEALEQSIRRKVEAELKERGLLQQDNATSTTSRT